MTEIQDLREALDHTSDLIAGVSPDQYEAPTPCPDFDVRALVNHLVAGNLMFASAAGGQELDMSPFGEDNLGDDPPAAYRRSAETVLGAWQRPGVLDESLSFGDMPGRTVIRLHLTEELAHGWDLARATGQNEQVDPHLAEAALDAMQQMPSEMVRNPQMFGDAVPVSDDAAAHERLVAFLGRDPLANP